MNQPFRRQEISDHLADLERIEDLFGWTYDIEQKRLLLRLELAALSHEPEVAR